jgi:protein-tyrosine phosphatase
MAEGLLKKALAEAGLSGIEVISAGVAAYDGQVASANSVRVMEKIGIDIKGHRSRQLTERMLREAGLILVMTKMHQLMIEQEFPKTKVPIFLWRENVGGDKQIPDPFGSDEESYRHCMDQLAEAVPGWVEYIKKLADK